jgi:hypothetical protein
MKTKTYWVVIFFIILSAFFLRSYRIEETLMFLSDQGRDAIVLKRLVTFEKMVFVGPTTSIGNVFTGPFYYYLVAPFMAMWRLDPVGPAIGVAIINTLGLAILTYLTRKLFGGRIALVFLLLSAFSANQILQSRFSWNPNPLAVFSLGTCLAFFVARKTHKMIYYILTGILFGISLQLHYIAIALPFVALGFLDFRKFSFKFAANNAKLFGGIAAILGVTLITFTPLILFELKNGFINTKTFLNASKTGEVIAQNTTQIQRLADTARGYMLHSISYDIFDGQKALMAFVLLAGFVAMLAYRRSDDTSIFVRGLLFVILTNVLMLSRLETGRYVHYFNPSYLATFFICGYLFDLAYVTAKNKLLKIIPVLLFLILFGFFAIAQWPHLSFILGPHTKYTQLTHAKKVADYILSQKKTEKYQVVGLPFYETEGHYRYYLEVLGPRPMPADSLGDPKELFVICHELDKKNCDIPGNAQWQLADFQNRHPEWKLDGSVTKIIDHIRVFRIYY